MRKFYSGTAVLSAATMYAQTASAHTGVHEIAGLSSGFLHPFLGLDHVLAMLAVGLWAALPARRSRSIAALPLLFMAGMLLGGGLGAGGFAVAYLETAIALSVAALGALILGRRSWSLVSAGTLVLLFGWLHGNAHGQESAGAADFSGYALGFIAATSLLHLCGIGLGLALARVPGLYRASGGLIGLLGLALLVRAF